MVAVAVVAKDSLYRDGYRVRGLNRFGFDVEGFASEGRLFRRLLMKSFDTLVIEIEGESDLETAWYLRGVVSSKIVLLAETGWSGLLAGVADVWFDKNVHVETMAPTLLCLARGPPARDLPISIGWCLSEEAHP